MRLVSLADVGYGATAVRPQWPDLPQSVRDAIDAGLGAPVVAASPAGGGFTRSFAAVLTTADGQQAFVKSAPETDPAASWYAREAAVTAALPATVPAPRPRWTLRAGGHFVLCLDAVDGRMPELPWQSGELDAALATWSTAATAVATPGDELLRIGVPRLSDIIAAEMSEWGPIAGRRAPLPAVPKWVLNRLDQLAELERTAPALVAGTAMMHGDLRVDNLLVDRSGAVWLCDWTWPCVGAPWFDTVTLLVSAYASGLDVDARLTAAPRDEAAAQSAAQSASQSAAQSDEAVAPRAGVAAPPGSAAAQPNADAAPSDGVDAALAALSGYWLVGADTGSPSSRRHQLFSGQQALCWLAARRGWETGAE